MTREQANQVWVAAACPVAAKAGVQPGMSLAEARTRLGERPRHEAPADPAGEDRDLHALARWCWRFTPELGVDAPDGLWLEISGLQRLFGAPRQVAERVRQALWRLGLSSRIAVTPHAAAAWALSRYAPGQKPIVHEADSSALGTAIGKLPLHALRLEPKVLQRLHNPGLRQVGHLLKLPRGSVKARFGEAVLHELDRLTGHVVPPLEPLAYRPLRQVVREFAGPCTQLEAIQRATREMLIELCTELWQHGEAARCWTLRIRRLDAPPARLETRTSQPGRDPEHLARLLEPRLERLHLGHGVERLSLTADTAQKTATPQAALFRGGLSEAADHADRDQSESSGDHGDSGDPEAADALAQWLDLMLSRLGPDRVRRPAVQDTHLPAEAATTVATTAPAPATSATTPRSALTAAQAWASDQMTLDPDAAAHAAPDPADRPSRLLDTPQRVEIQLGHASPHQPASLTWQGRRYPLISVRGPERITPPWWRQPPSPTDSGPPPAWDYYRLGDAFGRWFWAYFDTTRQAWFLHGVWG